MQTIDCVLQIIFAICNLVLLFLMRIYRVSCGVQYEYYGLFNLQINISCYPESMFYPLIQVSGLSVYY